jgi:hypothetical protein
MLFAALKDAVMEVKALEHEATVEKKRLSNLLREKEGLYVDISNEKNMRERVE